MVTMRVPEGSRLHRSRSTIRGTGGFLLLSLILVLAGCRDEATSGAPLPQSSDASAAAVGRSPGAPDPDLPLVVFLGDSLTAGYGLPADESFPARVAALLASEGNPIRIVNAGVSGDTTAGGRARLEWLLRQHPDVLVVCLGGNDGLRGLSVEQTEANLAAILSRAKAAGARVLLVGIKLPPTYGEEYTARFEAIYPALARAHDVPLVPFLLEGVGGDPALNLADGIHPNASGQERLARNVFSHLRPLVSSR
jgi:acyl-CoA thioesterase I